MKIKAWDWIEHEDGTYSMHATKGGRWCEIDEVRRLLAEPYWQCNGCGCRFPRTPGDEDVGLCSQCVTVKVQAAKIRQLEQRLGDDLPRHVDVVEIEQLRRELSDARCALGYHSGITKGSPVPEEQAAITRALRALKGVTP